MYGMPQEPASTLPEPYGPQDFDVWANRLVKSGETDREELLRRLDMWDVADDGSLVDPSGQLTTPPAAAQAAPAAQAPAAQAATQAPAAQAATQAAPALPQVPGFDPNQFANQFSMYNPTAAPQAPQGLPDYDLSNPSPYSLTSVDTNQTFAYKPDQALTPTQQYQQERQQKQNASVLESRKRWDQERDQNEQTVLADARVQQEQANANWKHYQATGDMSRMTPQQQQTLLLRGQRDGTYTPPQAVRDHRGNITYQNQDGTPVTSAQMGALNTQEQQRLAAGGTPSNYHAQGQQNWQAGQAQQKAQNQYHVMADGTQTNVPVHALAQNRTGSRIGERQDLDDQAASRMMGRYNQEAGIGDMTDFYSGTAGGREMAQHLNRDPNQVTAQSQLAYNKAKENTNRYVLDSTGARASHKPSPVQYGNPTPAPASQNIGNAPTEKKGLGKLVGNLFGKRGPGMSKPAGVFERYGPEHFLKLSNAPQMPKVPKAAPVTNTPNAAPAPAAAPSNIAGVEIDPNPPAPNAAPAPQPYGPREMWGDVKGLAQGAYHKYINPQYGASHQRGHTAAMRYGTPLPPSGTSVSPHNPYVWQQDQAFRSTQGLPSAYGPHQMDASYRHLNSHPLAGMAASMIPSLEGPSPVSRGSMLSAARIPQEAAYGRTFSMPAAPQMGPNDYMSPEQTQLLNMLAGGMMG